MARASLEVVAGDSCPLAIAMRSSTAGVSAEVVAGDS
jgi:hypothetical protein